MLLECLDDTVAHCRLDKASQGCMSIITVTHIRAALQAILNMCHASLYVTGTCVQDALLDEEGATPADGFSGDANAVSLRVPQAKAETQQRMMTAEEAHEVSKCLPPDCISLG